jgi:hypothetical protein
MPWKNFSGITDNMMQQLPTFNGNILIQGIFGNVFSGPLKGMGRMGRGDGEAA